MSTIGPLEPLGGGWSGETFVAEVAGERQVVRIHARRPERAEVDAALLRLVRGLLPVPEVLEVRPPGPDVPALLVSTFLPGVRGDLLLPTLDVAGLAVVGDRVGRVLAMLGGMPQLVAGTFTGPDLAVEPFGPTAADLPVWVQHLGGLAHWTQAEQEGLAEVAVEAQVLLDAEPRRCLVHGDLDPEDLLLDPDTLEVTRVLDWELAHAGHPATDLGNVLRPDRAPAYVDAVLAAVAEVRGTQPATALALARAHDLLRVEARTGDLGAVPPGPPGFDTAGAPA